MGKQRKAEESKGKLGKQRKAGESRRKQEKKGKRGKVKESTEKNSPKIAKKTLGRPRNIPSILKMSSEGSKRLTERSQVVLREPQEAPKRAPRSLRALLGRQEIIPGASRDALGTLLGRCWEPSRVVSRTH